MEAPSAVKVSLATPQPSIVLPTAIYLLLFLTASFTGSVEADSLGQLTTVNGVSSADDQHVSETGTKDATKGSQNIGVQYKTDDGSQSHATKPATHAKLTTKAQKGRPTIIVDGDGQEVRLKGIGWYGFNIGLSALGDLAAGPDAISNDFQLIVYRIRMLGFNAVRVAFAFDDKWGINSPPTDWTHTCEVPSEEAIMQSLQPKGSASSSRSSQAGLLPPVAPPNIEGGVCNSEWPKASTYERFIWVIDYFISQGFYVMLDFHSNRYGDSLGAGNESLYKQASWIASWVALVKSVLENTPAAHGHLLIDLINEPDGYSLTWETQGRVPSLGSYYLKTIDALYEVCPGCLFLIEGGGQSKYCGINWGNGFMTDPDPVRALEISSPADFLNDLIDKPYIDQVVLAPHFYCPDVSGADSCFAGETLFKSLDKSVGYLTKEPGWCNSHTCRVFPVILDEFGSTLANQNELACIDSIMRYSRGMVHPDTHAPITSWFFWSWQPDSAGTGGLVDDDWTTIVWEKIGMLTGGTKAWPTGMDLSPWYKEGFRDLTQHESQLRGAHQQEAETQTSPSKIAITAKVPVPAETPAPVEAGDLGAGPSAEDGHPLPTIPVGFIDPDNPVTSYLSQKDHKKYDSRNKLDKSKSRGALAGIIVGSVLIAALLAAVSYVTMRLRFPRIAQQYTPSSLMQSPLAPGRS